MMQENSNIYDVPSEEVQEVMGRIPSWVTQWGTTLLGVLIILLLILSWFAKFPDIINTSITISDVNPPVKIIAQTSGKIELLLVHNKQLVEKDQMLAVIDNPASTEDVMKLRHIALQLDTGIDIDMQIRKIVMPELIQAGELQDSYATLVQAVASYQFFLAKGFHNRRIGGLKGQMKDQQKLLVQLAIRDTLLNQQLQSENKKLKANQALLSDKIIAPIEFEDVKKRVIDQQINSLSNKTDIIQNALQQKQYAGEIMSLQQDEVTQQNESVNKIRDAAKRLRAQIDVWQQKYILKSPSRGVINLFSVWTEFQYVRSGDPIMLVTPPLHKYIVRGVLPATGAGKVKIHQKVLIKLNAFPYEEFGLLRGEVTDISQSMLDSTYAVNVHLNNGLTTGKGKKIPEQSVLEGRGEIVTNDKSIFDRLFESVAGKIER